MTVRIPLDEYEEDRKEPKKLQIEAQNQRVSSVEVVKERRRKTIAF